MARQWAPPGEQRHRDDGESYRRKTLADHEDKSPDSGKPVIDQRLGPVDGCKRHGKHINDQSGRADSRQADAIDRQRSSSSLTIYPENTRTPSRSRSKLRPRDQKHGGFIYPDAMQQDGHRCVRIRHAPTHIAAGCRPAIGINNRRQQRAACAWPIRAACRVTTPHAPPVRY